MSHHRTDSDDAYLADMLASVRTSDPSVRTSDPSLRPSVASLGAARDEGVSRVSFDLFNDPPSFSKPDVGQDVFKSELVHQSKQR